MDENDVKSRLSDLPKRELSERDRGEIWERIDDTLRGQATRTSVQISRANWATTAAVLLVSAGVLGGYAGWRTHALPSTVSSRFTARQADIAGESIGQSWRVIVVPSPRQKGPYYDFLFLYTGRVPATAITVQTPSTKLNGASNQSLESDTEFAGQNDVYLPQGPGHYAVTFHWSGKRNQQMNETLSCGNLTKDIRVKQSMLSGGSTNWRITYTEDAISGGQIGAMPNIVYGPLIHGVVMFNYLASNAPSSIQFKITESLPNGNGNTVETGTLEAQGPADNRSTYVLPIDQEGETLIPGQPVLHVQLTWDGRSEQLNLTRP